MSEYRVALDIYNGPLDLLLFLIRREEIEIHDIPISRITEQYLLYVEMLQQLDPDVASEFLVLAATLMEIKSRALIPTPPVEEGDEEIIDPRLELVRQLLEYKKFKDAARHLGTAAEEQSRRHPCVPSVPAGPTDELEVENLDIWDLFDAFKRLLEQTGKTGAVHQIGVDDTPLALHAEDVLDSIERAGGAQAFAEIFEGRTRAEMIGLFLALLELIRQRRVRAAQERQFGPILILVLDPATLGDDRDDSPEDPDFAASVQSAAEALVASGVDAPEAAPVATESEPDAEEQHDGKGCVSGASVSGASVTETAPVAAEPEADSEVQRDGDGDGRVLVEARMHVDDVPLMTGAPTSSEKATDVSADSEEVIGEATEGGGNASSETGEDASAEAGQDASSEIDDAAAGTTAVASNATPDTTSPPVEGENANTMEPRHDPQ